MCSVSIDVRGRMFVEQLFRTNPFREKQFVFIPVEESSFPIEGVLLENYTSHVNTNYHFNFQTFTKVEEIDFFLADSHGN